ncbi:hypothetical protein ACFY9C_34905 [Streptomyces filamentosus]|uniref:hypothetical protein n=1 Tax=Streptomyces filamentosus TaxID=67294 RepID=UPI0036EA0CAE
MTTPTHMRRVRFGTAPRRGGALALLLAGLTAVSGCSSAEPASPKPSTPASPSSSAPARVTPTPDSPEETAKKQAVAAYRAYWAELPKAYAVPAIEGTDLKRYTAAEALAKATAGVANLKTLGQVMTGAPVLANPTVTAAELDKKTPNVTISACLNVLPWKVVKKSAGKPAPLPSGRATKYVVTALVERWSDGWKVLKSTPHGDQPC